VLCSAGSGAHLVQRSTAQCSGATAGGGERPQSGRNRLGRPSNRIKSNNNHSHQYNKVRKKNIINGNMVDGVV
jgi:hypothetical protein